MPIPAQIRGKAAARDQVTNVTEVMGHLTLLFDERIAHNGLLRGVPVNWGRDRSGCKLSPLLQISRNNLCPKSFY
jgi:hypothetical protein